MRLRRRSSAASVTLARRTKPTTPTTSPRSSSRPRLMRKRGEDLLSPFFTNSDARNYEIPTPNLHIPDGGLHGRIGPGGFARADRACEHSFRPNLASSSERQTGGSRERCSVDRSRPAARDVYHLSLRATAQRISKGAGSRNSSGRAGDDYFRGVGVSGSGAAQADDSCREAESRPGQISQTVQQS